MLDNLIYILLLALVIDIVLGEYPSCLHPVVGMGQLITLFKKFTTRGSNAFQFLYGTGLIVLVIGLFTLPCYFLLSYLERINPIAGIICGAFLLKSTFSVRELRQAALKIKGLLLADKTEKAQFELRSLVSRDTNNLNQPSLVAATVESVAENTCDSFVAPLLYFVLLGVPGAMAYRVTNVADAMLGYHGKYEYGGKFAARLDDILNFIPARITGLLMVAAAFLLRKDKRGAWQIMLRDRIRIESPNAGWPMGATAGALHVQLEKVGHYKLGDPGSTPSPVTIDSAVAMMQTTALLWALICLTIMGVYFALIS